MGTKKEIAQSIEESDFDFAEQEQQEQQETETETETLAPVPILFTKQQLVNSKKYAEYQDVLNALLEDQVPYSFEVVDEKLKEFLEGKVKE